VAGIPSVTPPPSPRFPQVNPSDTRKGHRKGRSPSSRPVSLPRQQASETDTVVTMVLSQRRLKNDPDRRLDALVTRTKVFLAPKDLDQLTRKNLDHWITELREGETSVRHLRKRLEALRDGVERTCPACGRPVTGRPDAIYCTTECRVRAHRQAKKEQEQP
jgi:hypothetical protein